jgi:glutaminyl-peptide cyclotransferase
VIKPACGKHFLFGLILVLLLALPGCNAGESQAQTQPVPTSTLTTTMQASPTSTAAAAQVEVDTGQVAFDGVRAYQDVIQQVAFGPRLPRSEAHAQAVEWMQAELSNSGWMVELQETTYQNQPIRNVIAKRGTGRPWIILGAHYDSRFKADNDPDPARHEDPVPGANDGASGVAVLLELARVLPEDLDKEIWLVLFDAEDQGRLPGWDWILGSRAFVEALEQEPDAAVIVDMIGDADLNIMMERNSDRLLTEEIWQTAADRGHADVFIPEPGYSILDDHTPFLEQGIRAIDIIDFDYPYWHTVDDTPDKVSPDSLFAVGDTLLHWLIGDTPTLSVNE